MDEVPRLLLALGKTICDWEFVPYPPGVSKKYWKTIRSERSPRTILEALFEEAIGNGVVTDQPQTPSSIALEFDTTWVELSGFEYNGPYRVVWSDDL